MFEWLPEAVRGLDASGRAQQNEWTFILNPPATEEEIRQAEAELGQTFPLDLRAFLLRWNGASLFRVESDGFVGEEIGIRSAAGIVELNQEERSLRLVDDPAAWDNLIMFCDIPGPGADYCALNGAKLTPEGEYAVVDCHHDFGPDCWRRCVIEPAIEPWLRRAFDDAMRTVDPYYWINLPELREIQRECLRERLARRAAH